MRSGSVPVASLQRTCGVLAAAAVVSGLLAASGLASADAVKVSQAGQAIADPLDRPASAVRIAGQVMLTSIARAGDRLVAVGERGIVLLSDDNARSWRQAGTPVSVSLTRVQFVDAHRGWAIGHGGVVLHTEDSGNSWQLQLEGRQIIKQVLKVAEEQAGQADASDAARTQLKEAQRMAADGPDKPWLDLYFSDAAHGWIVGAYGLVFYTSDGGTSWQPALSHVDNPKGLHLYAVRETSDAIYLAGEQGFVARSTDGGRSFTRIATPYTGSYFGLQLSKEGRLILAGLRGHAYASDDQGESWQLIETPAPISFNGITVLADGRLLFVDQSGGLLQSRDGGRSLERVPVAPGPPLTDVTLAADGTLVASSFRGALRLDATNSGALHP